VTEKDWRDDALCATDDNPDRWFPDPSDEYAIRDAAAVCAGCPARQACAETAVANGEEHGIWGGVWATRLTNPRGRGAA
jgi:hypothetical protein